MYREEGKEARFEKTRSGTIQTLRQKVVNKNLKYNENNES